VCYDATVRGIYVGEFARPTYELTVDVIQNGLHRIFRADRNRVLQVEQSRVLYRSVKYRCNASCHVGIATPKSVKLAGERTEYAGRGAGRAICWVLTGRTSAGRAARATISLANSNQVQSPALVA
jgi:hypothetical protein